MNIYNFTVKYSDGSDCNLSIYQGKVLLVVNTAIKCGLTPQYNGLQKLYEKYKDKGFEILDFPCNQFANQAPGTNKEIADFCSGRFGIKFLQLLKIDVNGKNESPLYTWLKKEKPGAFFSSKIKWNFTKFLIDQNGNVVSRFGPAKSPESIDKAIIKLIGKPNA
jgi:glutathione peroxidase